MGNINAFANDLRTRYTRLVKENKEIMLKIEYTGQTALQKIRLSLTDSSSNKHSNNSTTTTTPTNVNVTTPNKDNMMDDSIDLNISTSSPYDMLSGMSTINISSPTDDGRRGRNIINGGGTAIDNEKALKSLNQCVSK